MIRDILAMQGHHVRAFADGASAVADFQRWPADLVITDLGMPEVSGWQVARSIRAVSLKTPIAFITAVGERVDEPSLLKLGITAVLHKPFRIAQVLEILQSVG